MSLRDYQLEDLAKSVSDRKSGITRQLINWACGAGKTVFAAHLPKAHGLKHGEQTLFLLHREELITQTYEKVTAFNPGLTVGIEKAEQRSPSYADIVIASVQTIGKASFQGDEWVYGPRLRKFDPKRFRIIVPDECHWAVAPQWLHVLRYFGVLKGSPNCDDSKMLIGITATPSRTDGQGLDKLFDKITATRSLPDLIDAGWLVHPQECWTAHTETDISQVKTKGDDFETGSLADAIDTPARNEFVLEEYRKRGYGLPALGFTVNVQHAYNMAELFNKAGIPAMCIEGGTEKGLRREAIAAYKAGKLKAMFSCDALTEGTDLPMATVGLLMRPDKSETKFRQKTGRLFRPWPSPEDRDAGRIPEYVKEYAILIDFADLAGKHKLWSVASLFGLKSDFDLKGEDGLKVARQFDLLKKSKPGVDLSRCKDIEEVKKAVERFDPFRERVVPDVAKQHSKFHWTEAGPGVYQLTLKSGVQFEIRMNRAGQREVTRSKDGNRVAVGTRQTLPEAFSLADGMIPKKDQIDLRTKAVWESDPPTPKLCFFLFGKDKELREKFTSGKAVYNHALREHAAGKMEWSKGALMKKSARFRIAGNWYRKKAGSWPKN